MRLSNCFFRPLALLSMLMISLPLAATDWPQWRGPGLDGMGQAENLPVTWSQSENVRWRLELPGPAASTPVVAGDRIFLTSTDKEGEALYVLAVSREGKILWRRAAGEGSLKVFEAFQHETSPASPSPVTDGERVWALFSTGQLQSFDRDGKPLWTVDLPARYGKPNLYFGLAMTPLLEGDRLFLQWLNTDSQWIIALDKKTGKELWKHQRATNATGECLHSYASPVLLRPEAGGEPQLLIHGADHITAHRLEDGEEIWRFGSMNPKENYNSMFRFVATPVTAEGMVVVPTAKRGPVFALKPGATRGQLGGEALAWTMDRGTPDVPSPLVADGLVYLSGETGTLTVLDAGTGEKIYAERVHQSAHRGSPVLADGKLFLIGVDGTVSVLRPGRKFEVLAQNDLGERLSASPAIAHDTLYLRTSEALYAISKTVPRADESSARR